MASILQTDLPTIMQQVETQLLNFVPESTNTPVIGDISNVYWVFSDEAPPPGQTGERDILLVERNDEFTNVQGAGRFTEIYAGLDIYLRSSYAVDRHFTQKQWKIKNRQMMNAMMDALMGYFPVDDSSNAYTIEGFVIDGNARTVRNRETETWGEQVGTYRFHYLPNVNTSLLTT